MGDDAANLKAVADKYADENVKLKGIVAQLLKERDEGYGDDEGGSSTATLFAFLLGGLASFAVLRLRG